MATAVAFVLLVSHCADKDTGSGGVPGTGPGDAETPPTGEAAVEAWLKKGDYKRWACEQTPHAARPGSAHSANRICSNKLLSAHGAGEYPVGAATVKELIDGSGAVSGWAVMYHFKQGGADAWYWYERTSSGLEADGPGSSGRPKDLCADCHSGANGNNGHDFVFTQVR
jgi:hypothetical protein